MSEDTKNTAVLDGTDAEFSMEEMEALYDQTMQNFKEGEVVSITDGPFKGFDGAISEIDTQKGKVKVMVSMFGRDTSVELDALQVTKVS